MLTIQCLFTIPYLLWEFPPRKPLLILDKLKVEVNGLYNTTTIKVTDDGPYIISGSFQMEDETGQLFEATEEVSLCRCGYSAEKPFCDGTHEEIEFESATRANDLMIEV